MGGAEGTKLDLDFMDMEKVSIHIQWSIEYIYLIRFHL